METFSRGTSIINPWYVTGFTEGEGTFTYSRCGNHMGLYFAIKLTKQDTSILRSIQHFFGNVGKIYFSKAKTYAHGGKTKSASYFRVTRIDELVKIIEHFDNYPLTGAKKESFKIWRYMVLLKSNFRRKVPKDSLEFLARQLSAISPRNQIWDGNEKTD